MSSLQLILKSSDRPHYVYILRSTTLNRTYVGYTLDLNNRLRKHNGEIVGGAKYTQIGRPWMMVCYITGFPNASTALQLEWRLHHSNGKPSKRRKRRKSCNAIQERLKSVQKVLTLEQWTKSCYPSKMLRLQLYWLEPGYSMKLNAPWITEC